MCECVVRFVFSVFLFSVWVCYEGCVISRWRGKARLSPRVTREQQHIHNTPRASEVKTQGAAVVEEMKDSWLCWREGKKLTFVLVRHQVHTAVTNESVPGNAVNNKLRGSAGDPLVREIKDWVFGERVRFLSAAERRRRKASRVANIKTFLWMYQNSLVKICQNEAENNSTTTRKGSSYNSFLHYHTLKYTYHKIQNAQILCCCTSQSVYHQGTLTYVYINCAQYTYHSMVLWLS